MIFHSSDDVSFNGSYGYLWLSDDVYPGDAYTYELSMDEDVARNGISGTYEVNRSVGGAFIHNVVLDYVPSYSAGIAVEAQQGLDTPDDSTNLDPDPCDCSCDCDTGTADKFKVGLNQQGDAVLTARVTLPEASYSDTLTLTGNFGSLSISESIDLSVSRSSNEQVFTYTLPKGSFTGDVFEDYSLTLESTGDMLFGGDKAKSGKVVTGSEGFKPLRIPHAFIDSSGAAIDTGDGNAIFFPTVTVR